MVEVSESMRKGGGLAAERMCGGCGWRSQVGHLNNIFCVAMTDAMA